VSLGGYRSQNMGIIKHVIIEIGENTTKKGGILDGN
jgi:hypothetical protein